MYQNCPSIPPADMDRMEEVMDAHVKHRVAPICDRALHDVPLKEDTYREADILHHTTQLECRRCYTGGCTEEDMKMLKKYFETQCVEDYNGLMGDCISNIIKRLSGLQSTRRHLGNETVEHYHRRVFEELIPLVRNTEQQFKETVGHQINYINVMAQRLYNVSRAVFETDANGVRNAWYDASGPDAERHPQPYHKGEEWAGFRNWVWSLPETQRAVQVGRTVDDVALEILYSKPEGFV